MNREKAVAILNAYGVPVDKNVTDGMPAPRAKCPCGAPPTRRMRSAGFGVAHDVCSACGHEFDELTVGME